MDQTGDGGPWDANDDVPEAERIDFGSLRVPVREGFEVQVSMAEDQPAWVTVVYGDSGLQLQAFAAPKTGGLWADVREEIADEVARAGGECEEMDGPFGVEVHALIAPPVPGAGGGRHPVRFGRGDRIAQLVVQQVACPVFHEVQSLPGSARADGGFGSTGGHVMH